MSSQNPQSEAVHDGAGPVDGNPARRARARRRSKHRRRLANVAGLLTALVLTGAMYSVFAPAQAADDSTESAAEAAGRELYQRSCITCHGENLEGVPNRGPSLIGVGEASVYFQVHTGRMPLVRQEADAPHKPAVFSDEEIDQLMAYVQSNGGGPTLPSGDLRDGDLAEGGELFRLNCASCHNFVGQGGALSSGKAAPSLQDSNDLEIYTAMLTGPENMPVFGDNQLTPEEKRAIVNYVQTIGAQADPGGAGIGRAGPVAEGLVIWVVGVGILMFGIFWMGSKA
ncbi:cytochrome bc1 complex diheme cytochrome c subunit [Blastococcus tunisiensis]|uniref:Cytochrome bc1 complex cytochrome c subunit n=1 Tax=Blastococcus tunisiensis TaxID=1798228 RepID=A0A1I2GHZ1_9ACTN|nr:cytochrome c [Blastococcus sp. DSM 46838]SFF16251.1 menaquinol-cytochrome c reductase cytochrome c1 subunit precursor [Blastococcus sp. DSM 46838]